MCPTGHADTESGEDEAPRRRGLRDEHVVLLSDVLANIRKSARPLFNLVRTADFARLLNRSVALATEFVETVSSAISAPNLR